MKLELTNLKYLLKGDSYSTKSLPSFAFEFISLFDQLR